MNATRRIRLELDADTYELHHYFASLRGLSLGRHLGKVLASYAASAEKEFPSMRAHMLAWRQARAAQPALDETSAKLAAETLDQLPF